ncbi:MAG: MopE-related protein, partial [Myxococcota bacterium]
VSGAGDVDGDGYDDIVVGGYLYSASAGLVRTFRGSDAGVSSAYEGTVTGSTTYCLGYSVGGGGDLNGDGYADIVAGGYCASSGNGYAAAYYGSGDADGDGYSAGAGVASASRDCNDDDPLVNPGVTDTIDDGIDNNCDGQERCYDDDDNDGYLDTSGDSRLSTDLDCADSNEGVPSDPTTDCDDADSGDYPGALETIGNGDDENCDGGETCYEDDDDDGYLDTSGDTMASADTDCSDAYEGRSGDATTDCDDNDASDRPGATEIVGNADDDDCDGTERCYDDDDDDGYLDASGDTRSSTDLDCDDANEGRSTDPTTDCDDTSATDYPGALEIVGNGDDESCDGLETCYDDDDNDGYLDRSVDTRISTDTDCADAYEGTSADLTTDCDDTDSGDRPGAVETVGNGDDEDCDGGESCYADRDNDGYLPPSPGTVTSSDTDCDDGGEGLATDPTTDCDDATPTTHPGATEQVGDGVDGDCDSAELCYADLDADTYSDGTSVRSTDLDCTDAGEVTASAYAGGVDCDDAHAASRPGGSEVCDDADRDEDCDGMVDDADASTDRSTTSRFYADDDGDGRGDDGATVSACDAPTAYVATAGDCDDARVDVYTGASETVGDGVDSDCDGGEICYADADGDAWASATRVASADADCTDAGEATAAAWAIAADCDDADASVNPGAVEVCDAADADEDCDGAVEDADASLDTRTRTTWHVDADGDTYGTDAGSINTCNAPLGYVVDGGDCDDADAAVSP